MHRLYYSRSVSLSAAKIPCPSWDRPSPFVACLARQSAARQTTKTDRLSHSDHAACLRLAAMYYTPLNSSPPAKISPRPPLPPRSTNGQAPVPFPPHCLFWFLLLVFLRGSALKSFLRRLVAAPPLRITSVQFLRWLRRFRGSRGARTRACRVDTRVDAWRYLTLVAAPPPCGAGNFAQCRLQPALPARDYFAAAVSSFTLEKIAVSTVVAACEQTPRPTYTGSFSPTYSTGPAGFNSPSAFPANIV